MYFIIGYRRKNLLSTALLLTAGLFVSSCHDEISNPDTQAEIRVETDLWHIMPSSRAATVDNAADLQSCDLRIDAYMNGTTTSIIENAKLVYDTDAWRFDDGSGNTVHYYWPIEGSVYAGNTVSSLDFVGYCPNATPAYVSSLTYAAGGSLSFVCDLSSYMTSAAQSGLTEFLWAYTGNQTKDTNSGTVNLTFCHPFARVKFELADGLSESVQVNSITLSSTADGSIIQTQGSCSFNGGADPQTITWTPAAPGELAKLSISGSPATGSTAYMVMPQTFASNLKFTVNATWNDWSSVTKTVSTNVTVPSWQPGYSYTYTLTLKKYGLTVDTKKYTEQW